MLSPKKLANVEASSRIISKVYDSTANCVFLNAEALYTIKELPQAPLFSLVVTSPPYNIGKQYERPMSLDDYKSWQREIITAITSRVKPGGSVCWQVGNYVEGNEILPLDILLHPIFAELGFKLRNRIIWSFGHGLHSKKRFSGRYEVILWYTLGESYTFNLDAVRVPSRYPGKRAYRGSKKGLPSGNPLGKNPEDVWIFEDQDVWTNIPNVKSNHIEKTAHPCQFPVGLIERLVLSMTNPGDLIFDPFAGVASSGVAAMLHGRRFLGSELDETFHEIGSLRLERASLGIEKYRAHTVELYSAESSSLSRTPIEWKSNR